MTGCGAGTGTGTGKDIRKSVSAAEVPTLATRGSIGRSTGSKIKFRI